MNIIYDTSQKTEVITKNLLPALGCLADVEGKKMADLLNRCRLHHVRKYDILESPGPRNEGYLWFSIKAMSHHYFYNREKDCKSGTRIWNKRDFIFDDTSLLEGTARRDTLEILEDDEVISISYADLDYLMEEYQDISTAIRKLSIKHVAYFQHKGFLMSLSPFQRVKIFIEENQCFTFCATQEIQAMHVNLTRRGFIKILAKIKESSLERSIEVDL